MSGDSETRLPASVPGAGPRQTVSLPYNVHPQQMANEEPTGGRRKRFQPFKKLQRIFRRKSKSKDEGGFPEAPKSYSASQLLPGQQRRRSGSPPLQSRLSVSHDSIFQSEGQQPGQEMGSAVSIPSIPGGVGSKLTAELRGVLMKRRGEDSDDDPGLPHSPATPPNLTDPQKQLLKGQSGKSGGSCSDGSLLSMYSSGTGTDDDIFGPLSKHSSKVSLARDHDTLDLETSGTLSHSAAKHRISVRPQRKHGAPRQYRPRSRPQTVPAVPALPTTLEEEVTSTSTSASTSTSTSAGPGASPKTGMPENGDSPRPETDRDQGRRTPSVSPSRSQSIGAGSPSGGPASSARPAAVKRSKSSLADRRLRDLSPRKFWSRDSPADTEQEDKKSEGFFSRIFGSRRSGRKKKEGRGESPSSTAASEDSAATRPPGIPRVPAYQRQRAPSDRRSPSPPPGSTDLHRPAIRHPPDGLRPSAHQADVIRPSAHQADIIRPVTHNPDLLRQRAGPSFLADVRAEVQALASGADRSDDSMTVSPQVVRRQRGRPGGLDSPRLPAKVVGLTAYQQRVARLDVSEEVRRRSVSCDNISGEAARGDSQTGMALGSVLNLIRSAGGGSRESQEPARAEPTEQRDVSPGREAGGSGVALRNSRESSGSPTAGPKSLDSSLTFSSAVVEPAPAQKSASAESVKTERQNSQPASGQCVPEFMKVQLNKVDTSRTPTSEVVIPKRKELPSPVSPGGEKNIFRKSSITTKTDVCGSPVEQQTSSIVHKFSFSSKQEPAGPTARVDEPASPRKVSLTARPETAGSSDSVEELVPVRKPSVILRKDPGVEPPQEDVALRRTSVRSTGGSSSTVSITESPDQQQQRRSAELADSASSEEGSTGKSEPESPPQLRRHSHVSDRPAARSSDGLRGVPASKPRSPELSQHEPVPLRPKPPPSASSEDSELLKVFKRRSLKHRDSEDLPQKLTTVVSAADTTKAEEKENEKPCEQAEETVVYSSFSRSPSKTAEVTAPPASAESRNQIARDSEFVTTRRHSGEASPVKLRKASQPAVAAVNSRTTVSPAGDPEPSWESGGEPRRPSWQQQQQQQQQEDPANKADWLRQTVKERREQREQREQQHLRKLSQKELIIEPEVPGRTVAGRSSRVLEMANSFQKLQTT